MSVSVKRSVFGLVATVIVIGLIVPVVFWIVAYALDSALGLPPIMPRPIAIILTAAAVLVGIFWISWAYSYLVFVGRGLPLEVFGWALHPTRVLVTTGPYAYVRNPMTLGMLFILLGIAFLEQSISGLVLIPLIAALLDLYIGRFEENILLQRFGGDYEEYRANVPSLIPRFSPYVHKPAGET